MRRRVLLAVPVLALPVLLAGGLALFVLGDGIERRMAHAWQHSYGMPGSLVVGDVALDGLGQVQITDLTVHGEHRPVLTVPALRADRSSARLELERAELHLGLDDADFLRDLAAALADLPPGRGEGGSVTIRDAQLHLPGLMLADTEVAIERSGSGVSGQVAFAWGDISYAWTLSGTAAAPVFALQQAQPLDLALLRQVLSAYSVEVDEALWRQLPSAVVLESVRVQPDAVALQVAWPGDHPWPVKRLVVNASRGSAVLEVQWRDATPSLMLALQASDADLRCEITAGSAPMQQLLALLLNDDPRLALGLAMAVPPQPKLQGSSVRVVSAGEYELELRGSWDGGTAAFTGSWNGTELRLRGQLDDNLRGSLKGGEFLAGRNGGEATWDSLRPPGLLGSLLPAPWSSVPWPVLAEALPGGECRWQLGDAWQLTGRHHGADQVLAWQYAADGRLELAIDDMDVAPFVAVLRPVAIETGHITSARLVRRDGAWGGRASARNVSLRWDIWGLREADLEVSLDHDGHGRLSSGDEVEATWRSDLVTIQARLPAAQLQAPLPRDWTGSVGAALDPRSADGRWRIELARAAIPGVIAPWRGRGWLGRAGRVNVLALETEALPWLSPVLVAALPASGAVRLVANPAERPTIVVGEGWSIRPQGDLWRVIATLDAARLAAVARALEAKPPSLDTAQLLCSCDADGRVVAALLFPPEVAFDADADFAQLAARDEAIHITKTQLDATGPVSDDAQPTQEEEP
ncbi:MAG: hypothetical protein PF961_21115 [Planctomycetota bacterium]|nr:hypothetical protein [Planctomycetota bacterium]